MLISFRAILCVLLVISATAKKTDPKEDERSSKEDDDGNFKDSKSIFNQKNNFLSRVLRNSFLERRYSRDRYPSPKLLDEYDFVIIGAGPAGCVLANRLTENENWSVLLLEAGDTESTLNEIPMMISVLEDSSYAWKYPLERDKNNCWAMNNGTCKTSAGKGVGGGTLINYMVYSRGTKRDYDKLSEAGNKGWSYEEVLPYFMKSENANLKGLENSKIHGKNGPLSVEHLKDRTVYSAAFLDAAREMKQNVWDYNNGYPGFDYVQTNTRKGRRHSANKAFVYPVRTRKNLRISPKSTVVKIQIDKVSKIASAVQFYKDNKLYTVRAKNEIILSAGAIISPKLLMLSGVGPKRHLRKFGIPLIQNLKVGEALFEHVGFGGLVFFVDGKDNSETAESIKFTAGAPRWFLDGTGPLASIGGIEAVGFINTNTTNKQESSDVEIILLTQPYAGDIAVNLLGIREDIYNEYYAPIRDKKAISLVPVLLTPKSQGKLKLRDSDPSHIPKIYGNTFDNEKDLDVLVSGIKFILKMSETAPFKKLGAKLYTKPFPLCKRFSFESDAYWKCTLKSMSFSIRHPVATCKMGPDKDSKAIVDSKLRVRGIKQLRVVDGGVFPFPLSAHNTAPIYMLAEKAADMIKSDWTK